MMTIDALAFRTLLGTALKGARKRAKLTQSELAEQMGVNRTTVVNIETGYQGTSLDVLYLWCKATNTDVCKVLPTTDDVFTDNPIESVTARQQIRQERIRVRIERLQEKIDRLNDKLTEAETLPGYGAGGAR